jgi:hypothetical protein
MMSNWSGFLFGIVLGGLTQWIALVLSGGMDKWSDAPTTNQLLSLIHIALWGIAGILVTRDDK